MDENGDGVLDRDEIEHCIRNLGFPFEEVIYLDFYSFHNLVYCCHFYYLIISYLIISIIIKLFFSLLWRDSESLHYFLLLLSSTNWMLSWSMLTSMVTARSSIRNGTSFILLYQIREAQTNTEVETGTRIPKSGFRFLFPFAGWSGFRFLFPFALFFVVCAYVLFRLHVYVHFVGIATWEIGLD